jgi:hypothetical protein
MIRSKALTFELIDEILRCYFADRLEYAYGSRASTQMGNMPGSKCEGGPGGLAGGGGETLSRP